MSADDPFPPLEPSTSPGTVAEEVQPTHNCSPRGPVRSTYAHTLKNSVNHVKISSDNLSFEAIRAKIAKTPQLKSCDVTAVTGKDKKLVLHLPNSAESKRFVDGIETANIDRGQRWIRDQRVEGTVLHKSEEPRSYWVQTPQGKVRRNRLHLTPLPKMGSTMDASEDGQRQEQRNEETPTSTSTWLSRRCKDDQEQETEEDCPTPTASSTRDGRMQRDNQDQDPEKSLPSMPAVHTRYGRAVKIPRRFL
ncbi:hypothetical protein LAZ67_10000007 [Cordylochernes scorpioides]|uniref:Uncharacterized protein n=1 Tax=Cordylochernes scorpioides TaxID=51811 RepID=A0ABY6KZQ5_9ARAC|nr:hypothetical protein LAZ67_10000007 [Cordylochernes scorpioides]